MRVSIIGQAPFGEAVLQRLTEDGVDVVAVSAPQPAEGARPDALWTAATERGLPLVPTAELKQPEAFRAWRANAADLCVMAFVTDILPDEVFAVPPLGTIQYHPSLLPLHRGSSSINWPIIFGRAETGVTIFWPEKGIDTGPILMQKRCPIGPQATVGSLYFDHLFPLGVEAVSESVALVAAGRAPREPQDHARATYEPPCRDDFGEIRWHEPAERIYSLIRGCNPQPGAWTRHNDLKLRIFEVRLTGRHEPGMPGRVLGIDGDGLAIRLNEGVLQVERVQPEGGKKMPAAEWAQAAGLARGYRFR